MINALPPPNSIERFLLSGKRGSVDLLEMKIMFDEEMENERANKITIVQLQTKNIEHPQSNTQEAICNNIKHQEEM